MPEAPGFVALQGPGAPVVGMETGIFAFTPQTASLELLLPLDEADCRFNDATVDQAGRLWVSTMALDASPGRAAVYFVTAELGLQTVASGLTIPNALAVDRHRGRLLFSDSLHEVQRVWTLQLDDSGGPRGTATEFASTVALRGRPDGAALLQDGTCWIAGVDGGEIYTFDLDGTLIDTFPLPVPAPTSPSFVGHDGRTVVVTSKAQGELGGFLLSARLPAQAGAGVVQPYWTLGAPRPRTKQENK